LEISPDFFDYFKNIYSVLKSDESLLCVSAWNDNGQKGHVKHADVLYRSNFFPGLGWMMTKRLWNEFSSKWPAAYWDDWIREPSQRKERDCIRPEISRTYTFGREGSSIGQFFDQYLAPIVLNTEKVDWNNKNLNYLQKDNYDIMFDKMISSATIVNNLEEITQHQEKTLLLYYNSAQHFQGIANQFGIMSDTKAGIPRTAYKGAVIFYLDSNRIILAPTK